jgi:hypothetical protein
VRKSIIFGVAMIVTTFGLAASHAGAAERAARATGVLLPHEIVTIVRSAGLKPVGKPTRKGTTYLMRAIDDEGLAMRVVVDGRAGEVISVTPVVYGREFSPIPPSVYDSGAPVYEVGPPVSRATSPIIIEDESEPPVYRRAAPAVPVAVPVAPPTRELQQRELQERDAVIVPPPSPPEVITAPLAPPSTVAPPEGEDGELLPPPPPRFPQRVNAVPSAKPKPAKSAASKPANASKSEKSNATAPAN